MEKEITNFTKSTQRVRIMRHLQEYGSITSLEALREYGIMRLASRISELRQRGEKIERSMCSGQNKFGETIHFAEYRLKAE